MTRVVDREHGIILFFEFTDLSFYREEGQISLILFLLVFFVYFRTLCPTLYFGNSGDLGAAIAVWGVPHPTGYPTYIILNKLLTTLIPVGNLAYRMNFVSALFAASAVVISYRFLEKSCKSSGYRRRHERFWPSSQA